MYRLLNLGVLRLADNLHITRDMAEWMEYRAWMKDGNVPEPMPAVVVPPLSLAEVKQRKLRELTVEALIRVQAVMPEVSDIATAMLLRELWLSIAPAARSPTPDMLTTLAIFAAWRTAAVQVKQCATAVCVDGVVAVWP